MRVVVIGCGNLGSRHAESLSKHQEVTSITLVDPSYEGLIKSTAIVRDTGFNGAVLALTDIAELSGEYSLAVVSTSSTERAESLQLLMRYANPEAILLEKLLSPNSEELVKIKELVHGSQSKFWVNCPMPYFSHYKEIWDILQTQLESSQLTYKVSAGNLGLISNSIHYLDHFSHLTGREVINVSLSPNAEVIPSKRNGYSEVLGSMTAQTIKGDVLEMLFFPELTKNHLSIEITSGDSRWLIDEIGLTIESFYRDESQSLHRIYTPFQSELTHQSLSLVKSGQSPLWGSLNSSFHLHSLLFDAISNCLGSNSFLRFT